ncbi:MAG: WhiB family transcriptional regulator, redox-sensing transcriptional regulator [Solirubrobacteraceae bacterium]|jgi:WhiB family redox-sensing transcriptional regulator|nr:WhiB family transcriptional regulator, redox-sensing transcriptional regulator [Solirubrobacteraceae bacterium]
MADDWQHRAACRDEDPELFFPVGTGLPAQQQTALAKAVCAGCPVVAECLAFATRFLPEGIAAGTTATERSEMRRRSRPVRSRQAERREAASRLRSRGWSAAAIAKQLEVNERSVYRLLKQQAVA